MTNAEHSIFETANIMEPIDESYQTNSYGYVQYPQMLDLDYTDGLSEIDNLAMGWFSSTSASLSISEGSRMLDPELQLLSFNKPEAPGASYETTVAQNSSTINMSEFDGSNLLAEDETVHLPHPDTIIVSRDSKSTTQTPNTGGSQASFSPIPTEPKIKRRRKSKKKQRTVEEQIKRRESFLSRNRIAASKSRDKKKRKEESLEDKYNSITRKNQMLHQLAADLIQEVKMLKLVAGPHTVDPSRCTEDLMSPELRRVLHDFLETTAADREREVKSSNRGNSPLQPVGNEIEDAGTGTVYNTAKMQQGGSTPDTGVPELLQKSPGNTAHRPKSAPPQAKLKINGNSHQISDHVEGETCNFNTLSLGANSSNNSPVTSITPPTTRGSPENTAFGEPVQPGSVFPLPAPLVNQMPQMTGSQYLELQEAMMGYYEGYLPQMIRNNEYEGLPNFMPASQTSVTGPYNAKCNLGDVIDPTAWFAGMYMQQY